MTNYVFKMDDPAKPEPEPILLDRNAPVGLKDGNYFYDWHGYWIISERPNNQMWTIQPIDRSIKLHQKLEGRFTSRDLAEKSVISFGDPKAKEIWEAAKERKKKKLDVDIANGRKEPLLNEEELMLLRSFKESQKKDKPKADASGKPIDPMNE